MTKWTLQLNSPFEGYAPAYWTNTYSSIGNSNQANAMVSIDLTDPNVLKQGPGLANLDSDTNPVGTIKGIMHNVASAGKTYGISATKIYDITATAIVEKAPDSAITGGEDIVLYGDKLKFSHDNDIGSADNPWANSNQDWWTTTLSGTALQSGEAHQLLVAGTTGLMTVLDGSWVGSWDGTADGGTVQKAFDTQDSDIHLVSQVYNQNRFWFAGNKPNVAGRNEASIFVWDGNSNSWENKINIDGKIGTLFVKNGITFVVYTKNLSDTVCTLGYVDGSRITDVLNYDGSLPSWYQVCEYKDFKLWASGTDLMAFGGGDLKIPTRLFKLGTCGAGGLANPFGTPITAASAKLYKLSGYTVTSSWYSLLFQLSGAGRKSVIDKLIFNIDKPSTGARVDWTLKSNAGTSLQTGTISEATDGAIIRKIFYPKVDAENCQLQLNFANGSTTNALAIRNITLMGHYLD